MTNTMNIARLATAQLKTIRRSAACQVESHTSKLTADEISRANRLVDAVDDELDRRTQRDEDALHG